LKVELGDSATVPSLRTMAAPPFAVFEGWEARTSSLPGHADFEYSRFLLIDQDWSGLSVHIVAMADPSPLIGLENQTSLHRVAVHIAQLLHALVLGTHHENRKSAVARYVPLRSLSPSEASVAQSSGRVTLAATSVRSPVSEPASQPRDRPAPVRSAVSGHARA
jgi:hypothetical protein